MRDGTLPEAVEDLARRRSEAAEARPYIAVRRLLAELFGTFALTTVAAGGTVIAAAAPPGPSPTAQVVAPALLVMALIYSIGPISGAHFNPAVTFAFALRGDFPWSWLPGYWLTQLVGATLGALLLRGLFGPVGHLGATLPHHGAGTSAIMEALLTFLLLTVVLATAANRKIVGHNAALAVAATIALAGLFAAPISGASMNPARSFGPALVSGQLTDYWIYLVGPMVGASLAVGFAWVLRGPGSASAREAAQGDS